MDKPYKVQTFSSHHNRYVTVTSFRTDFEATKYAKQLEKTGIKVRVIFSSDHPIR